MSKFTFTCDNNTLNTPSKITNEISAILINDVIEEFERFLRGSGYYFDGHLEIVDDYE